MGWARAVLIGLLLLGGCGRLHFSRVRHEDAGSSSMSDAAIDWDQPDARAANDARSVPDDGGATDVANARDAASDATALVDTGTEDAAVMDAPPASVDADLDPSDSSSTATCVPGALLCDAFESGIDPSRWTVRTSTGSQVPAWAPEGGLGGSAVVRMTSSAGEYAALSHALSSPITSGTLFVRAYVKVRPGLSLDTWLVLIEADNGVSSAGSEKISLDLYTDDVYQLAVNTGSRVTRSEDSLLRDLWVCLELGISVDDTGATGAAEVYADQDLKTSAGPGVDTMPPTGFQRVSIMVSSGAPNPPVEVLFDNIQIARTRIGCD